MHNWQNEFSGSYNVPEILSTNPLIADISWGNDACPSFTLNDPRCTQGLVNLRLWAEHEDPGMRKGFFEKRFAITLGEDALLETDDVSEAVETLLTKTVEEWGATQLALESEANWNLNQRNS